MPAKAKPCRPHKKPGGKVLLCKNSSAVIENGYLYDDNGNCVSSNLHGANYVTGAGNRLQSDGVYNYEYDDEGNLVKRTEIATGNYRELAYDFRNRLVLVTERDSAAQELSFTSYLYDALDRRNAKQVDLSPTDGIEAPALLFVYDGANLRLEFLDSDGFGGASLPVLVTRYFNGPGVDNVIAVEHYAGSAFNAGAFWLGKDHLGSTRQVLSASGEVNRIHYDSFGNVASQTNAAFGSRSMYTGRELDAETGLYYYRARYYDSSIGRFLQEDPIGFAGGMNLLSYVGNNPVSLVDPFGTLQLTAGWQALFRSIFQSQSNNGGTPAWHWKSDPSDPKPLNDPPPSGGPACSIEHGVEPVAGAPGGGRDPRPMYKKLDNTAAERQWAFGGHKSARQWLYDMKKAGWNTDLINEAVSEGTQFKTVNRITGGSATRYVSPTTGQSVVIDDVTKEIIQLGEGRYLH